MSSTNIKLLVIGSLLAIGGAIMEDASSHSLTTTGTVLIVIGFGLVIAALLRDNN